MKDVVFMWFAVHLAERRGGCAMRLARRILTTVQNYLLYTKHEFLSFVISESIFDASHAKRQIFYFLPKEKVDKMNLSLLSA